MTTITEALAGPGRDGAYDGLLKWVLFVALMVLSAMVAYDYGLITYLFEADQSRISVVITALFFVFCFHCLWILIEMSREYRHALAAQRAFAPRTANAGAELARLVGTGLVGSYLGDLRRSLPAPDVAGGMPDKDAHLLLQSLAASLRRRTKVGAYGADLLYKLGMLGTMVGFVMMLNSMGDMADFDVETLRQSLQKMIAGMAVSLLTTIAGLIGGILLRAQYMIAENLATDIVQCMVQLTETSVLPRLKEGSGDV